MRSFFQSFLLAVTTFCALPAQAQILDQMLTVQAATTSVGRSIDSTTTTSRPGRELWRARSFSATTSQSCAAGKPAGVGIASGGGGITNIDVRNSKGEVSITWSFGAGIPAAAFPYRAFEVNLVNTSQEAEISVRTVAVLSTNLTAITIGYPGVRVDRKLSPKGRIVPFKFESAAPELLRSPSTVIRSLTLRLSSPAACDTSFAIQAARFVPQTVDKSKRKTSEQKSRVSPLAGDSLSSQGSSTSSNGPIKNPCEEDPTVPAQIRECEETRNLFAGECMKWECSCVPERDNKSYFISSSNVLTDGDSDLPPGAPCTNKVCGGIPGKCSNYGECLPSQFADYYNHSINIEYDGIGFRRDDPQTSVATDCFDHKKFPEGAQLCNMTVPQVEALFLASMKVGARCRLDGGKTGVCSHQGQCVLDVNSASYCKDRDDCAPCGQTGNICWKSECLSRQDASRKLCESTHTRDGGKGICGQCFARLDVNSVGTCGTGVRAPDARGVNMDGASCSRYQDGRAMKGQCQAGSCVLTSSSSSSSSASASH